MSETEEQEIAAVNVGFKQAITGAFLRLYEDSSDKTPWGDGAVIRFSSNLTCARAARALALKVIEEGLTK